MLMCPMDFRIPFCAAKIELQCKMSLRVIFKRKVDYFMPHVLEKHPMIKRKQKFSLIRNVQASVIRKNNLKRCSNACARVICIKAIHKSKFYPWHFYPQWDCKRQNRVNSWYTQYVRVIRYIRVAITRGWSTAEFKPCNFKSSLPNSGRQYFTVEFLGQIKRELAAIGTRWKPRFPFRRKTAFFVSEVVLDRDRVRSKKGRVITK